MSPLNVCCNPLKNEHKAVYKNVVEVPESWNYKFKNIGNFICTSYKAAINKLKDSVNFDSVKSSESKEVHFSEMDINDDNSKEFLEVDNVSQGPSFVCTEVDEVIKKRKLNAFLEDNCRPPIKKRFSKFLKADKQKIMESIDNISSVFSSKPKRSSNLNNFNDEDCVRDLKEEFSKKSSRNGKISVLTRIPFSKLNDGKLIWTMKRVRSEFNVSRRLVRQAIKLRSKFGPGSHPKPKEGHCLKSETIKLIEELYLSDAVSRVMPEMKDYISVVFKDGLRRQEQKKRFFYNIFF